MPAPNSSVLCPSCGKINSQGNKFCFGCGQSLAPATPLSATTDKTSNAPQQRTVCAFCGAAVTPGNKFCLSCGKPADATPAVQTSASSTPAPQVATKVAAAAATPAIQPTLPIPPSVPEPSPVTAKIDTPALSPRTEPAAMPEAPPASAAQLSKQAEPVCTSCGAALVAGQKFCLACGTPAGTATKTAPAPPPRPVTAPVASAPVTQSSQSQPGPFQEPPRGGSKALILVIVLLAIMGVAGWYVWKYVLGPDVSVAAIPPRIHVAISGQTLLMAGVSGSSDTDVAWSIQEGNKGGQITPLGVQMDGSQARSAATYTAPQTPGTFHVVVTSHANPSRKATFEIVVGGVSQPDTDTASAAPAATQPSSALPAPPAAVTANPNAQQIVGPWRWPSGERMVIGADSIVAVTSDSDPSKNRQGTYRFTDNSHLQVDLGNGDVRTWQILGVDGNYLRVLSQSKADASPTAIVFAKIVGQ